MTIVEIVMRTVGDLFMIVGASFAFLGALGLLRMPDAYNRLQAGAKTATLGALSFLIGVALVEPGWWPMIVCIIGFVLFTNPVGASTVSRAIYVSGVRPWLKETREEQTSAKGVEVTES